MRFLAVVLVAWVGVRALSLGIVPGAEALAFDLPSGLDNKPLAAPTPTAIPPILATEFAPIDPVAPPVLPASPYLLATLPYGYPAYYPEARTRAPASSPAPAQQQFAMADAGGWSLDRAAVARYADPTPPLDQWPLAQIASPSRPSRPSPAQSVPAAGPVIDRLSMSSWAMLRRDPGEESLAANGMLGGSQAGTRILWRFHPRLAASLRTSAPIGGTSRTAELALGLRYQPVTRWPIAVTVERRQSFGQDAGPSAFALFTEAGAYDRPIIARFNLDAYLQAGAVGIRDHALFIDGSATLTRPLWRQFSAGFGMWGGAQPGLTRLDAGPRLSMRVGRSMRVHLDYRHRLVGNAEPGSGPVVTISGDF